MKNFGLDVQLQGLLKKFDSPSRLGVRGRMVPQIGQIVVLVITPSTDVSWPV